MATFTSSTSQISPALPKTQSTSLPFETQSRGLDQSTSLPGKRVGQASTIASSLRWTLAQWEEATSVSGSTRHVVNQLTNVYSKKGAKMPQQPFTDTLWDIYHLEFCWIFCLGIFQTFMLLDNFQILLLAASMPTFKQQNRLSWHWKLLVKDLNECILRRDPECKFVQGEKRPLHPHGSKHLLANLLSLQDVSIVRN